jgi:hypothetical protein
MSLESLKLMSLESLKLMSLAAALNARTHRAAADNRSPRENPSGVREKLSFAVSSYTAHLRLMSLPA